MDYRIIIAIILLVTALAYKVIHDYKFWLKERGINHKKEWWRWLITAATCIPCIVLFTLASEFLWYYSLPLTGGMCALFIWLWFDGFYNKLRGFNFWFTGSDDKDDAATDNFLQAIPVWLQVFLKTVPLAVLIYIYIKSL